MHEDARVLVNFNTRWVLPRTLIRLIWSVGFDFHFEGFSFRPKQRLPLRWFAEEIPPRAVFRQDELEVLSGQLAEALRLAGSRGAGFISNCVRRE
ncbi:MAG: hypothetical protein U0361_06380 [Nitrospiraceae bacterium]